jgi:hypothetical protein
MSNSDHLQNQKVEERSGRKEFPSELDQPIWSVVSFDKREAGGLIYSKAMEVLEKLGAKGIAGLCVITDEAAARIRAN